MSTCVVTGGAGFLGSHLCEHLLGQGHRVICLDNLETGSLENIAHIRDDAFEFRNVDITEYVDIPEAVDFVYHLASPASPIDYLRLPLHTLKVGSHGTHHMLGVAKVKRARFLIASTSEVYGDPQVHPQREDYWGHVNPIGPRGVYDEAKRYAEALTMAYHRQQGVDTAMVRIFNTYGPRMRAHDGRAIPTFLRQALQDRPLTVFGDGSQTRSFCYVDDLIRGIVALAESEVHAPVNIGNPNEFTLLELAKTVVEVTESRSEIVYEALPTDDPQQRQPDIGRARDGRAIPTFLRQALQDRPLTVFGDGSQTRIFCYVDDLIDGIVLLAESDMHMPVNICNPNEFTLLELAKAVIEVTESRSEIIY
ncbi:MAG TPA: NAD-dependent epimerase/dehydratase family protein, partial [Solirubrobacterales bacterium]|nr:NAD-dependent epimerase/dehydratase family protein [Solirubrobacterales bacterium]